MFKKKLTFREILNYTLVFQFKKNRMKVKKKMMYTLPVIKLYSRYSASSADRESTPTYESLESTGFLFVQGHTCSTYVISLPRKLSTCNRVLIALHTINNKRLLQEATSDFSFHL